jgi:hypothetical protein
MQAAMSSPGFLHALVTLASCETLEALLTHTVDLIDRELGLRGYVEVWDRDGTQFSCGDPSCKDGSHCTWVGVRYTIGAIHLDRSVENPADVELLATQLAPLAERLIEIERSAERTIREDVAVVYERRIRDALIRSDWNASAVARELCVSRNRVAAVVRRWKRSRRN